MANHPDPYLLTIPTPDETEINAVLQRLGEAGPRPRKGEDIPAQRRHDEGVVMSYILSRYRDRVPAFVGRRANGLPITANDYLQEVCLRILTGCNIPNDTALLNCRVNDILREKTRRELLRHLDSGISTRPDEELLAVPAATDLHEAELTEEELAQLSPKQTRVYEAWLQVCETRDVPSRHEAMGKILKCSKATARRNFEALIEYLNELRRATGPTAPGEAPAAEESQ